MLTANQRKEYDDLKEDVREYVRNLRVGLWIIKFAFFMLLIEIPAGPVSFLLLRAGIPFATLLFSVPFSLFLVLFMVGVFIQTLGQRKSPSVDKLVRFYTYATVENLDNYFDLKRADTIQRKKEFRKKAIESAYELRSFINDNWIIGDFKLGKELLGDNVSKFKELLFKRLIPNIEKGDPETFLRKASDIMYQLITFFEKPSTEDLKRICKYMSEELGEISLEREGYLTRFSAFLYSHGSVKHALGITLITMSSICIYLLARYLFLASDWDSFRLSAEFWAILAAGYFVFMVATRKAPKG